MPPSPRDLLFIANCSFGDRNGLKRPIAKIPSLAEAQHYCRQLAQSHYENFSVVSWFVPPSLRQDLYNFYAYCRWSDDLADELDSPSTSTRLLEWWKQELRSCGSGEPMHPVMVALRDTLQRHQLELTPFEDLLSAFLQDQHKIRYENDLELFDYCRRSANPVGRILLQLAGVRDASCLYWSDCICTGLQVANFCQDIANDAARGRIYWPRDRWNAFGLDEKDLLDPKSTSLKQLALSSWVHDARAMLELGRPLATFVPKWLQRDVQLFLGGGLQILDNIARQHYDVWSRRIEVTKLQKVGLIARQFLSFHRSSYRAMHSEILSEEVDSDSARLHESHTFAKEICRKSGSSFYRTFGMLRPEKADAMMALYAYARLIDDVVDAELPSDPSLHPVGVTSEEGRLKIGELGFFNYRIRSCKTARRLPVFRYRSEHIAPNTSNGSSEVQHSNRLALRCDRWIASRPRASFAV